MITVWKPNEFKIGINMAGAVSAGAYTAGVLDFLAEALEQWQKSKDAFRLHLANPAPLAVFENPVPLHDVSIEVFSGASAGGMCAAIASVMVQGSFEHISDPASENTSNTFYEAWVNQIDISKLLTTNDIKNDGPLVSLLDSTIIDSIAQSALTPGAPSPQPYISDSLTLFLTLTNVRGVPYQLYSDPSPTLNEFITYYADFLQFETTKPGSNTISPNAKPLPAAQPQSAAWPLLRDAAKATGAFPLFLAPRELTRDLVDYTVPRWVPLSDPPPAPPISSDLPLPPAKTMLTLNVDGGVTDNDPFNLAHDFIASHNPKAVNGVNPRPPLDANCAVISVAPFPSSDRYDPQYNVAGAEGIFAVLKRLVTVLLSQSRFLGESLAVLTSGAAFSRFVIAPSDLGQKTGNALQCASLGAFGGFMERSFRAHDFLLGRRNCQMFLKTYFRLPLGNPIISAGQSQAGGYAPAIEAQFAAGPPPGVTVPPVGKVWVPVIPLVGTAFNPIPGPVRGAITRDAIGNIANLVLARLDAIKSQLLEGAPASWLLKLVAGIALSWPTRSLMRTKIVNALTGALSPDVKP
jgi:predicted acylesterase/phospholipase RssA